jgi:hypothetical protein
MSVCWIGGGGVFLLPRFRSGADKTFFSFLITGHYPGVFFYWSPVTGSKEQRSAKRRPVPLEPPAPRGAPFPPAAAPPPSQQLGLTAGADGGNPGSSVKTLLQLQLLFNPLASTDFLADIWWWYGGV